MMGKYVSDKNDFYPRQLGLLVLVISSFFALYFKNT
jgi:hypothetical protein